MHKNCWHLKIESKLFLTYMAIGIVPLILFATYALIQNYNRLEEQNIETLYSSATDKVNELGKSLDIYKNSMSHIIYNVNINQIFMTDDKLLQNDYISKYLISQVNITQSLDNTIQKIMIYTDNDYNSWNIKNINTVLDNRFYYEALTNGSYIDVTPNQIIISRKFSSLFKGSEKCVLTIYVDRNLFFYRLNDMIKNKGLLIRQMGGEILYHSPVNETLHIIENNKFIASQIADNFISINHKEFLAVGLELQNVNWEIICYDEKLKMLLPENMLYISLQLCGVILLTIILSMFFSKRIKVPIVQLNEKMREVENGNYELITMGLRYDEFGEMQQYFNSMIKQIRNLIEVELEHKIKLRDSQLQILYAQISPHFLYNTLSVINMRAILLGSDEISTLVKSLATFYQTSLNHGKLVISVSDELKNLKAYINIQEIMHDNSFDVFYDIDKEIEKFTIVNFILQPLAENAIEHGVEMIDEHGIIAVLGKIVEDGFILSVEDNGPGFVNGMPDLQIKGKGYGIYNVNSRIKLLYGENYGLTFSESILGGAKFELHLPAVGENEDNI